MSRDRIHLSPPHMGEHERMLLLEAFDSNWVAPIGPHIHAFEQEFAEKIGPHHAVALSSGTAALHLALEMLGVGRDDEVLAATLTFAATANAIAYQRARPVFIDCSRETWTLDPELLREELAACAKKGKMPKAVITVDLYGQCADYDPIREMCANYEVPIVEDAAEALGATYKGKSAGSFGEMAAFSFNGNKIITTSGGGMLVSPHVAFIERARFLSAQARDPAPHYQHSSIGYNYRMSNLLAAIGRGQLRQLDLRLQQRRANNELYRAALARTPGISFMPEPVFGRGNSWLTCIMIDPTEFGATREDVRVQLEKDNIEARPVWKPMHLQPVFQGCRVVGGAAAEYVFERGLCLPSGSSLSDEDRDRTVQGILSAGRHTVSRVHRCSRRSVYAAETEGSRSHRAEHATKSH
jgi:dTDP-4-amino-4,6-dideoxygalactose transaminase